MKYVVNTKRYLSMATNWLVALDFDMAKLEAAYPPCVNKYRYLNRNEVGSQSLLNVRWEDRRCPVSTEDCLRFDFRGYR